MMDPACLTEDEINYELALRQVPNLSYLPRRARAVRLRELIQDDSLRQIQYENSSQIMDRETNINLCQLNINEVLQSLDTAFQQSDFTYIRQAHSRLLHYRDRLAIIEPTNDWLDTHRSLTLLVQSALRDIDEALGKSNKALNLVCKQDFTTATGTKPKSTTKQTAPLNASLRIDTEAATATSTGPSRESRPSISGTPTAYNNAPQCLGQLLERQWQQGSQFLMEQAEHFDVASLLSCLHQLQSENTRLEEHVNNLVTRRDELLAVNARLAISLNQATSTNDDSGESGKATSRT